MHLILSQSLATHQAQEHLNLRRLFFPMYYSLAAQEAIYHHHTGVGYYTTMVARTSINLVSLVLFIV